VNNGIKNNNYFFIVFVLVARGSKLDSHVIIGTPGTTLDWVLKLRVFDPKKIGVFVLDEADVMIDTQGHQDQTIRIYKYELQQFFHASKMCIRQYFYLPVYYLREIGTPP